MKLYLSHSIKQTAKCILDISEDISLLKAINVIGHLLCEQIEIKIFG
jgi:hypothetical protein